MKKTKKTHTDATLDYPFTVRRLTRAEGGGYLVEFPDLPGCMADGKTIAHAIAEAQDALKSWLKTKAEFGKKPAHQKIKNIYSAKYVQRLPKTLHQTLSQLAKAEGVSLNTLALTFLAEGAGRKSVGKQPKH